MSWKGISISGLYFVILLIATGPMITNIVQSSMIAAVLIILFVWVSPGYLAARISKKSGVLNATISGLIVTLIAFAASRFFNVTGDVSIALNGLLISTIFWFGLGAVIWHIQSWLKQRNT